MYLKEFNKSFYVLISKFESKKSTKNVFFLTIFLINKIIKNYRARCIYIYIYNKFIFNFFIYILDDQLNFTFLGW